MLDLKLACECKLFPRNQPLPLHLVDGVFELPTAADLRQGKRWMPTALMWGTILIRRHGRAALILASTSSYKFALFACTRPTN